jgi:hypothetical protein
MTVLKRIFAWILTAFGLFMMLVAITNFVAWDEGVGGGAYAVIGAVVQTPVVLYLWACDVFAWCVAHLLWIFLGGIAAVLGIALNRRPGQVNGRS